MIIADVWKTAPFMALLLLAGLQVIPGEIYEAAKVDGATMWQRFRKITLPLLAPGLAITFCLSFVMAYSVFPSANLVGDPSNETRVISIAAYHAAREEYDYPMGSAIAMIMAAVMLLVIGLVMAWRGTLYRGATGGKG
jgi:putative spermidine/putrescine transport system permease protein